METWVPPDPQIARYILKNLDAEWKETLANKIRTLRALKYFLSDPDGRYFDLDTANIGRLKTGAAILYRTHLAARRWLKGMVISRNKTSVIIACVTRPGTFHLIGLTASHPDWQNYFTGVARRNLDRFEKKFLRRPRLRKLFAEMREMHAGWRFSASGLAAELSRMACAVTRPRREAEAIVRFMDLLRKVPLQEKNDGQ